MLVNRFYNGDARAKMDPWDDSLELINPFILERRKLKPRKEKPNSAHSVYSLCKSLVLQIPKFLFHYVMALLKIKIRKGTENAQIIFL